jgi:hypothetical protein
VRFRLRFQARERCGKETQVAQSVGIYVSDLLHILQVQADAKPAGTPIRLIWATGRGVSVEAAAGTGDGGQGVSATEAAQRERRVAPKADFP